MKKQRYLIRSIIALVLAISTIIPLVGYIFGLASVILAIDSLAKLKKDKTKKGKGLAIAALIITILIIVIKITILFTSFFGEIFQTVSNFSQLSYEEAIIKCKEQKEDLQTACYLGLLVLHVNDTRVTSGETCYDIKSDDARTSCFTFVAALTNNTEMCAKIEIKEDFQTTQDTRNYCFAIITKDDGYCGYIINPTAQLKCKSDLIKKK